jgi:hypothetical protein
MADTTPTKDGKPLVERARDIMMRPRAEWPAVAAEPATIGGIYTSYVMILAAIPPIAGLIGMSLVGFRMLGITVRTPIGAGIAAAVAQYAMALIGVFLLALIIEALAPTFGGVKDRIQAFKVAAYGSTAAWVGGIFALIPQLGWIWIIPALYSFYLIYLGLPVLMKAPEEKALPYTLVTVVAAILLYVVVSAVVGSLLYF